MNSRWVSASRSDQSPTPHDVLLRSPNPAAPSEAWESGRETLRRVYVFVMNSRKEGKSASYASKASVVVHARTGLAAGNQRMRQEQAILNTIAH